MAVGERRRVGITEHRVDRRIQEIADDVAFRAAGLLIHTRIGAWIAVSDHLPAGRRRRHVDERRFGGNGARRHGGETFAA